MRKIRYIDQNNNVYHIQKELVHYVPMKAENSSSGVYSGGKEAKVLITQEDYREVVEIIFEITGNKDLQVQKRQMLTALIYVTIEDETMKYIISRSRERNRLETKLKEVISKQ